VAVAVNCASQKRPYVKLIADNKDNVSATQGKEALRQVCNKLCHISHYVSHGFVLDLHTKTLLSGLSKAFCGGDMKVWVRVEQDVSTVAAVKLIPAPCCCALHLANDAAMSRLVAFLR
jgi:hypothetical protein